jgi:hypothetical protein
VSGNLLGRSRSSCDWIVGIVQKAVKFHSLVVIVKRDRWVAGFGVAAVTDLKAVRV